MRKLRRYLFNIALAADQLLNAALGGDPDETVSSRCFKRLPTCVLCRWLCAALDRVDPGHCLRAVERDEGKHAVV